MNTPSPIPTPGEEILSASGQWAKRKTRTAHRRLRHTVDRSAGAVVWVGGIATIVSILGIFLNFICDNARCCSFGSKTNLVHHL